MTNLGLLIALLSIFFIFCISYFISEDVEKNGKKEDKTKETRREKMKRNFDNYLKKEKTYGKSTTKEKRS